MSTVVVRCEDGKDVLMKRTLIPRFGAIQTMLDEINGGFVAFVKVDGVTSDTWIKIIQWVDHYDVRLKFYTG